MIDSCYFCQSNINLNDCMVKSLYNKHTDIPDKQLQIIDALIGINSLQQSDIDRNKLTRIVNLKYKQIVHLNNREQNLSQYVFHSNQQSQFQELLQYYKYRVYVPLFTQNKNNLSTTIHCYYYEKLKLYYNSVKRKLNLQVEESSQQMHSNKQTSNLSQEDQNEIHKEKRKSNKNNQNLLSDLTKTQNADNINQYQTESKALELLVKILVKNQKFKKIQTLKTEDCGEKNQFKDIRQRLAIATIPKLSRKYKKNINIQSNQSNSNNYINKCNLFLKQKLIDNPIKVKNIPSKLSSKKVKQLSSSIQKGQRKSVDCFKLVQKHSSLRSLRAKQNKILLERYRSVKNEDQIQHKKIKMTKKVNSRSKSGLRNFQMYESMPKISVKFDLLNNPSVSNNSIEKIVKNNRRKNSSKQSKKKASDTVNIKDLVKNNSSNNNTAYKSPLIKHSIQSSGFQIESQDNIISVNKKKLEILKARTQKKKQL